MTADTDPESTDSEQNGDDRPDVTDEEFLQAVEALERVEQQVDQLSDAVESIDTGLTETDTVALLYGRRNSLNKTTVEEAFQTLDDITAKRDRELIVRLLGQYSDLTLSEAEEFLSEVDTLRNRYGDRGDA